MTKRYKIPVLRLAAKLALSSLMLFSTEALHMAHWAFTTILLKNKKKKINKEPNILFICFL
jgi:hypothetical protein